MDEANLILAALQELPAKVANPLTQKLQQQAQSQLPKDEVPVVISAATGLGLRELLERAYALVKGSEVPTEWRR